MAAWYMLKGCKKKDGASAKIADAPGSRLRCVLARTIYGSPELVNTKFWYGTKFSTDKRRLDAASLIAVILGSSK